MENSIDVKEWKKFKIKDIFIKKKIKKYSSEPDEKGNIPFITSSSINNGISNFIKFDSNKTLIKDCMTISTNGACLDCFYQENEFYISTDVEILMNKKLNKYHYFFLKTIIEKDKYRYSYGRKPKNDKIFEMEIILPSKLNEKNEYEPDWEYMETYTRNLYKK